MRLLVVSQYFWPENFRINDLVSCLVARGHEVTVLTGEPNYPEGTIYASYREEPARFANLDGAPIVRIPVIPRGKTRMRLLFNYLSFALSATFIGAWRLRGRPFDAILVFQNSPITAALPAIFLRRCKRVPILMWVLDLWPETLRAIGMVRSPRLLNLVGLLVRFVYKRCALILTQSRAFFDNIEFWARDGSRTRYFPGWAEDIFARHSGPVAIAPEVAGYQSTFNVMFAGNIGEAQDFPAILDAADRLRDREDIRWLIIGEGRAADDVRARIRKQSLEHHVRLLGRYPIECMPSFFAAAQVLLVSLRADPINGMTIPGKVQSYLASGVPLLGMIDGEGARVIEESGAGLTCPAGNGAALARRVETLAAMSDAERREMGRRGQGYCRKEFDRETLITRLETWLNEVVRQPGI